MSRFSIWGKYLYTKKKRKKNEESVQGEINDKKERKKTNFFGEKLSSSGGIFLQLLKILGVSLENLFGVFPGVSENMLRKKKEEKLRKEQGKKRKEKKRKKN